MSSAGEYALQAPRDAGCPGSSEQPKSSSKPFTVVSGNSDSTKPTPVPQFKFIPDPRYTPKSALSLISAVTPKPIFGPLSITSSPDGNNPTVTPKPIFGPLSITSSPGGVSPAVTPKPIFGPLSLNIKPPEKENNKSTASTPQPLANDHHSKALGIRQVQDSGSRVGQRAATAPLSLVKVAAQVVPTIMEAYHSGVDAFDEMGRHPKKIHETPESPKKAAIAKSSVAKGPDVTTDASHRPKAIAANSSQSIVRITPPAPRTTGSSEESQKAHSTSTSASASVEPEESYDESDDESDDESETSSEAPDEADPYRDYHLKLLTRRPEDDDMMGIMSAPIFTHPVLEHARSLKQSSKSTPFPQYAFFAGNFEGPGARSKDPRIFYNVAQPSSVFICGQQGSGKSHTLSCLLEGCLMPSKLGRLPHPLTGVVFHYDTFISDASGTPCEAAYLASSANIKVRVLCAPTSVRTMQRTYAKFPGVSVQELRLKESDLNTKIMLDLMQVGGGSMPLYMHVIQRLLRDLRLEQQKNGTAFNYVKFRNSLTKEDLTSQQSIPLQQRLDTLESFMVKSQVSQDPRNKAGKAMKGTAWTPCEGLLTIVDLSCPCVTAEMACSLFNICLSLFLEQPSSIGRVVALDEAHKYMNESAESQTLTNALLSTIRLQRHLGARVFISTQEPTISPKLLDLCSITIVHHFQSPDWLRVLKAHLAGVSSAIRQQGNNKRHETSDGAADTDEDSASYEGVRGIHISQDDPALDMMSHIVKLRTGDALLFAPSAIVGLEKQKGAADGDAVILTPKQLHHEVMRVRVRARITADGGRSILAT